MSRLSVGDAAVVAEVAAIVNSFSCSDVADPAAVTVDAGSVTVTWTTNDPGITPDHAITIANGSSVTAAELTQFCVELNAQIIKARADIVEVRAKLIALLDSLASGGMLS